MMGANLCRVAARERPAGREMGGYGRGGCSVSLDRRPLSTLPPDRHYAWPSLCCAPSTGNGPLEQAEAEPVESLALTVCPVAHTHHPDRWAIMLCAVAAA